MLQSVTAHWRGASAVDSMDQESMTVGWLFAPSGKFKGDFDWLINLEILGSRSEILT